MRKYMSKSSLVYRPGRNIAGQFTTLYLYVHCVRGNRQRVEAKKKIAQPKSNMETVQSSALYVEHLDNGKYGNRTCVPVD
jgi:hypothetical protein